MTRAGKILVTGAGGQLGRALMCTAPTDGLELVGLRRDELDIGSEAALDHVVESGGFDAIINTAAYTAVDQAETDARQAFKTNHLGAVNLARVCARRGIFLVHVSTDYVFDGTKHDLYLEGDPVNPTCVYGQSKAAGEAGVRQALDRHIILRTSWLFGPGNDNFVGKIFRFAQDRDELSVVADQHGSPTSADDLAEAIVRLLREHFLFGKADDVSSWGTYHCSNADSASWYELAKEVIACGGDVIVRKPAVRAIPTSGYPAKAKRPANSRLNCDKLESNFGIRLRPWREAVATVVTQMKENRL